MHVIFVVLSPNKPVEENVLTTFESQLEILDNIIKNGGKFVTFNDGKLLMVNSSYYSASIKFKFS